MLSFIATWKNMLHFLIITFKLRNCPPREPLVYILGFDKLMIDMTLLLWVINLGRLVYVIVISILKERGLWPF